MEEIWKLFREGFNYKTGKGTIRKAEPIYVSNLGHVMGRKLSTNNRGYLIVELILASVLAMTVAYFLLNLVVKMSSKNQDLYVETALLTDKAIMTNLVMEDVNKYTLIRMNNSNLLINFIKSPFLHLFKDII